MGNVASPLGAFRVNEIAEALAYCSDSAFCLPMGLVMMSCSSIEINFDISHEWHPEGRGQLEVSI